MFVKVKMIDENGNEKGRAYTYESDIDLEEGDKVIADMGGNDRVLKVVGMALPKDYEDVEFEIKKVKSLYDGNVDSEGVIPEDKFNILIEEETLPVIKFNFEEVKTALNNTLQKYSNMIVTADTLMGCKATQKELAGVKAKINRYRIDKAKELSVPITEFENQCKELFALVEKVELPIKDGIKVFDDEKRLEKKSVAEELIIKVAEEMGLSSKYASRLVVDEKYCNLTAKESDVRNDLEAKALTLKVEQDRELELIEIIKDTINSVNQRIEAKIEFKDFERMISNGAKTTDILYEINSRADIIFKAEHPEPKVEVKEEVKEEVKPIVEPFIAPLVSESTYFATYRVTGSLESLRTVSQFIRMSGLAYRVIEQGEV